MSVLAKMNKICLENELRNIAKKLVEEARWCEIYESFEVVWCQNDDDLAEEALPLIMAAIKEHGR